MSKYTSENYRRNTAENRKLGLYAIGGSVLVLILATLVLTYSAGEVPMNIVYGFVFSKVWFVLLVLVGFAAPIVYAVGVWRDSQRIQDGKLYLFILAVVFWFFSIGYTAQYKASGYSDPNKRAVLNEYLTKIGQDPIK